ncbi:MAG TPA: chlorite dismutase family protein [Opitutaceae bacterium]|nr:chlorite dismutase family protein [Opitutaceae bacterium]
MNNRLFTFSGGDSGLWRVTRFQTVAGDPLPTVDRLEVLAGDVPAHAAGGHWTLRGITSNERYVNRDEKTGLVEKQPALGRANASLAALIPIRKTPAWWALTQDERRRIFEEQSNHIRIGMQFLPAIARRLHHCRDLGPDEPFDFLTWFEYSPADADAFEQLVLQLRSSPEWKFVDREIDIRLERT